MWDSLYDYLVQLFAGLKWSAFLAQNSSSIVMATKMRNVFRNDLYAISGWITFVLTLLIVLVYYFIINRKGGAGYAFKPKYWLLVLGINSMLITLIMIYISIKMTAPYTMLNPFKFSLALAIVNLIYSILLFFIASMIFKRGSVANTTPF